MNSSFFRIPFQTLALLLSFLVPTMVIAQPEAGGGASATGAFYKFSSEGVPINVFLSGAVGKPGRYEIPGLWTLRELLYFAGGPTDDADLTNVTIVHDTTVDSTLRIAVVVHNFQDYTLTGNTLLNPGLYPNDLVVVPRKEKPLTFAEVSSVVTGIISVALSIITLYFVIKGPSAN